MSDANPRSNLRQSSAPMPQPQPVQDAQNLFLRNSEEIQGNILAGFNKDHQILLFLSITDTEKGKNWLAELLPKIATTKQVADFNDQFSAARRNRGGDDPENLNAVWVNLSLTNNGIKKLSPAVVINSNKFQAFTQGAVQRAALIHDEDLSAPGEWIIGKEEQNIHAILIIAADKPTDLQVEVDKMRELVLKHDLKIVFEQHGNTLPSNRAGHEHFGFKDGISQPGVIGFHEAEPGHPDKRKDHPGTDMLAAGEFIIGYPDRTKMIADAPGWMKDGSFQVFRRLAQDVPGWWSQVTQGVHSLPSDDPMKEDLLAAKLVGRWRSGTPLAQAPVRDNRSIRNRQNDNDFEYTDDPDGHKTPRFAHIRKMYPRGESFDEDRRIIRRGIPFGKPFDPAAGRGHGVDADRGLLFIAYMQSIEAKFEFLQNSWANNPGFLQPNDGPDPVIGTAKAPVTLKRENIPDHTLDFRRFVHTTGAVYSFAPSLTTLKKLSTGTPL